MKNPAKLQEKIAWLLRGSKLHIGLPFHRPWSEIELREVAGMVQDFVNRRSDVVESDDPLREWLEEYMFFDAERKGR